MPKTPKTINLQDYKCYCKKHKYNRDITCDECNKNFSRNHKIDAEQQNFQDMLDRFDERDFILEFYPRTVLRKAQLEKDIPEINNGTLTANGKRKVKQFITQEIKAETKRVLDLIADEEGWEESRDFYAKQLNLPAKYAKTP